MALSFARSHRLLTHLHTRASYASCARLGDWLQPSLPRRLCPSSPHRWASIKGARDSCACSTDGNPCRAVRTDSMVPRTCTCLQASTASRSQPRQVRRSSGDRNSLVLPGAPSKPPGRKTLTRPLLPPCQPFARHARPLGPRAPSAPASLRLSPLPRWPPRRPPWRSSAR